MGARSLLDSHDRAIAAPSPKAAVVCLAIAGINNGVLSPATALATRSILPPYIFFAVLLRRQR